MPEITIYTNDGDCANGVAEINPFTVGDATDEWTLKFNNGTDFYSPSNVTMRVGHTNGLPDGTYSNAFKWFDRADNQSTASIGVSSGVPTLSFDTNPVGGVVGTNGVYVLRGPQLDGAITSIQVVDGGSFDTEDGYSTQPVLEIDGSRPGSYTTGPGALKLDSQYSLSPSGNALALATGNIDATSSDLASLIGNSMYFSGGGVGLGSIARFSGNFSVSFKWVSFFPQSNYETLMQGSYNVSGQPYDRTILFYKDNSGFVVSMNYPNVTGPNFSGIDLGLIEDDNEYDVVLSRSGGTWSLTISRNGSVVTSDTSSGTTDDFAVGNLGLSLEGIMRDVNLNGIHSYVGGGAELSDWTDSIGTNNATIVNGVEYTGQGSGLKISSTTLVTGGSGFLSEPIVTLNGQGTVIPASGTAILPSFKAIGNWAKYEFPFKRDESGNNIIAATTLSPYSDGQVTDVTEYDHSTLVIRPETVATASLTQSGTDWVGTMNPVNAYVTERLALRNSTQLDLQIRGDGRTLFQGQLTVLNKIA
jgi:hypothetical protein